MHRHLQYKRNDSEFVHRRRQKISEVSFDRRRHHVLIRAEVTVGKGVVEIAEEALLVALAARNEARNRIELRFLRDARYTGEIEIIRLREAMP